MDFLKLVSERHSCRKYSKIEIEDEKIQKILEATRLAPSAVNKQPYKLILIKNKGRKEELRKIYDKDWFVEAPIVIAAISKTSEAWVREDGKNYADVDTTIALDHLILEATDLGLGTCWIANFNSKELSKFLNLNEDEKPLILVSLGYAEDKKQEKIRKSKEELFEEK